MKFKLQFCILTICISMIVILFSSSVEVSAEEDLYYDTADYDSSLFELGRYLFYEKRLSSNNEIACASCHKQAFSFSDTAKLSQGKQHMTDRNSMSLINISATPFLFWDGRSKGLKDQVLQPIINENELAIDTITLVKKLERIRLYRKLFKKIFKDGNITYDRIATSIVSFEKKLSSPPKTLQEIHDTSRLTQQEKEGYQLFNNLPSPITGQRGAGCVSCHNGDLLNNTNFFNNGIGIKNGDIGLGKITKQQTERGLFRVPSLINVHVTAPYMHDGRFKTLEEVVDNYNEHLVKSKTTASFLVNMTNHTNGKTGLGLTKEEKKALVSYLLTLKDENILTDKSLSDPFIN